MIKVEEIGPNLASREYTELWETVIERFPMLNVGICTGCYAAPQGCQCWNDE